MRLSGAVFLLALSPIWAQPQITKSAVLKTTTPPNQKAFKIAPQTFRDLERRFDGRLATLAPEVNEPTDLLGNTRGLYVEGCGVIFTAELSLVKTPELSPFLHEIPKEMADRVHKRRLERLPLLKTVMKEMLDVMARTFLQIPNDQQVVLAVRLYYSTWESSAGMPAQVMVRATRAGAQLGEIVEEVQ
jgi:hypothetical protein